MSKSTQSQTIAKLEKLSMGKQQELEASNQKAKWPFPVIIILLFTMTIYWRYSTDISAFSSVDTTKVSTSPKELVQDSIVKAETESAANAITPTSASNTPAANTDFQALEVKGFILVERKAALSSIVSGMVSEVLVKDGAYVSKGQPLVILDQRLELAQLAQAESEITLAKNQLSQTKNDLAIAKNRLVRLINSGKFNLRLADKEDQESLITGLELQLRNAEIQILVKEQTRDSYQLNLDRTVITAPFSGVLVAITVQPGEVISPLSAVGAASHSGIGILLDPKSLIVKVEVSELYLARVKAGQQVTISPDAYPERKFIGEVERISKIANKGMASVDVYIKINEYNELLLPHMAVSVVWQPPTP